ncbi:MAG TPA: lasso peptide biosynthesis B2 protein [Terriglobales bacterium]|nr:lasso peptide biosynthesis B2 protein [Terriglobales bacterium]
MNRLRRFLRYPCRMQLLLAEAFFRLVFVSFLLRLAPSSHFVRRWAGDVSAVPPRKPQFAGRTSEEICWAVATAARYLPFAACLPQSLVASAMLHRAGHPAEVRIGVAKDLRGFQAHAWVTAGEKVVLGESAVQFAELPKKKPAGG